MKREEARKQTVVAKAALVSTLPSIRSLSHAAHRPRWTNGSLRFKANGVRIFQPMPCDGADDPAAFRDLAKGICTPGTGVAAFEQSGNRSGACWLDKNALLTREPALCFDDFVVRDDVESRRRILQLPASQAIPARRIPNPDRGCDGLWMIDNFSMKNRGGTSGLKAEHRRQASLPCRHRRTRDIPVQ